MLPSMPLLMTPMRELVDDSSDSSDESPSQAQLVGSNVKPSPTSETSPNLTESYHSILKDSNANTSGLQLPDKACDKLPTPEKRSLIEPTSAQKKKKKTQHKKTLIALTPDTGENLERSAQNFAEAYFYKVKSLLSEEKWTEFVQELVYFEVKTDKQPAELYKKMEVLLSPHEELIDEFLAFLLPHQALEVNRFIPYLMLVKMKEFFRKMSILLLKRQCLLVFSTLESLAARSNVSLADVKAAVLPLLKSSSLLTNLFLELFPGERPPDSLMTDFEQVHLMDDSLFETIIVPDCPDPYGNDNCICPCHATQKNKHCVSCGIKYLNGRVYLQYGKVLRLAKVTFHKNKHLDLKKLEEDKCRSRRRHGPKSMISPSGVPDSEDPCGAKKSPRTPRIRAPRPKVCKKVISGNKEEAVLEGIFPLVDPKPVAFDDNLPGDLAVDDEMKRNQLEEQEFDEVIMENECNTEEEDEDLNKGVHSENESSQEGEDMEKDLELVNDCSFDDEDMDEMKNENDVIFDDVDINIISNKEEKETPEDITKPIESCNNDQSSNYVKPINLDKTDIKNVVHMDQTKPENLTGSVSKKRKVLSPSRHEVNENFEEVEEFQCLPNSSSQITAMETDSQVQNGEMEFVEMDVKSENLIKSEEYEDLDIKLEEEDVEDTCIGKETEGSSKSSMSLEERSGSTREWTREEDELILQTFQHENGLEQTFETACLQLPNRSKEEIQERFEVLLILLKEMISNKSNAK